MPKPRYKILIVEDNPLNLELEADLLEANGFDVVKAQSAEAVVDLTRSLKPDLILMDLSLPGMDGLAATQALKAESQTRVIPVIAVTAHAMKGDEEKAMAAGCDGYLTKPIDTRTFSKAIMRFLVVPPNSNEAAA